MTRTSRARLYNSSEIPADPRIPKLPVWAQNLILDLMRQRDEAQGLVRETQLASGAHETIMVVDPLGPVSLGIDEKYFREVGFRAPILGVPMGGRPGDPMIRFAPARNRDGKVTGVRVNADSTLAIMPQVSNDVVLQMVAR